MGKAIGVVLATGCFILGAYFHELTLGIIFGTFLGGIAWLLSLQEAQFSQQAEPSRPHQSPVTELVSDLITGEKIESADAGDMDSMILVGCVYLAGSNEISQDLEKGSSYLLKAARKGHIFAEYLMAGLYWGGIGIERDVHKAYAWGLAKKHSMRSASDEALLDKLLTSLMAKNEALTRQIIDFSVRAQNSFPKYENEVSISHEQMVEEICSRSYQISKGLGEPTDSRPFVGGYGPLPVEHSSYAYSSGQADSKHWRAGDILGYLENMRLGAILIIPHHDGSSRPSEGAEWFDLSDEGWIPHRQ